MKKPKRKSLYVIMAGMAMIIVVLLISLLLSSCSSTEPTPTTSQKVWAFNSVNVTALFVTEGETGSMTVVSGEFHIKGQKYVIGKKLAITKNEIRLEDAGFNLLVFSNPIFNGSQAYITCEGYVYDTDTGPLVYVPDIVVLTRR